MNPNRNKKNQWPEVVGKSFEEAKKIILTDRPDCHVVHIKPGTPMTRDLDFERVFVITEGNGDFIVTNTPYCG